MANPAPAAYGSFQKGDRNDSRGPYRPSERMLWAARVLPVIALLLLIRACWPEPADEAGSNAAAADRLRAGAGVVGCYLAVECPMSRVLLLMPPPGWDGYSVYVERDLKWALADGLGKRGKMLGVTSPRFPESVRDAMAQKTGRDMSSWHPPVADWFTFDVLRDVLKAHPKAEVVVSAIGLPRDCEKLFTDNWQPTTAPTFVILDGPLPRPEFLELAMTKGVVAAAVAPQRMKLQTVPDGAPDDLRSAFVRHSCLITPDTLERIAYDCPRLFTDLPAIPLPGDEDSPKQ